MSRFANAYLIAARRTAFGRVGGLHRARRVEDLAARAISAALADAKLDRADVNSIFLGNASEGGNPARLAGLAAGLPDTVSALTIDRQCASGLDAILAGFRLVALGEATVVAAGGAESGSTAPWRLARPRSAHQIPRFLEAEPGPSAADIDAAEVLARAAGISREQQDSYASAARRLGVSALADGRTAREIAAFGDAPAGGRDEPPAAIEKGQDIEPFRDDGGTLTIANTSHPGDGAAMAIIVDEATWKRLARPPALRLIASATIGASPGSEAAAPLEAVRELRRRCGPRDPLRANQIELNETSAVQALAFRQVLDIAAAQFNPTGGALAVGRPFSAGGAMLAGRLFAGLISAGPGSTGLAATGARGGEGVAAMFEATAT